MVPPFSQLFLTAWNCSQLSPHPLDLMQSRSGPAKSSPQQVLRLGVHHRRSLRPRCDASPRR
jgi:hypothetical protein